MKKVYQFWFWLSVSVGVFYVSSYLIKHFFYHPMVSVVMPTYNRANASLSYAIDSILNQTFDDFELIIIDDASTDKTPELVKRYQKKDKRIVLLRNEKNQGIIDSLNRGLDVAKGKYIARMDDDDVSLPERLERQVAVMEAHPEITVLGTSITGRDSLVRLPPKEAPPRLIDPEEVEINTYFSSGLAHPSIMIRKSFLDEFNLRYDKAYLYAEDCGLYKDILNHGGRLSTLQEPLLRFGFIQKLNKPDKYASTQYETFKKIQREKIQPLLTPDESLLGHSQSTLKKCTLMKQLATANRDKHILSQEKLEEMIAKQCPQDMESAIWVKHPYWSDFVEIIGEKRLRRAQDEASLIGQKGKEITVKWDKWDTEIYRKIDDKTWEYVRDQDGHVKTKK